MLVEAAVDVEDASQTLLQVHLLSSYELVDSFTNVELLPFPFDEVRKLPNVPCHLQVLFSKVQTYALSILHKEVLCQGSGYSFLDLLGHEFERIVDYPG